jgi:hypothetical protein
MREKSTASNVEPNSGLGQPIVYMLKHWQSLTLVSPLRQPPVTPGAPLVGCRTPTRMAGF